MTILISLLAIFISMEVSIFSVFGGFIKEKDLKKFLDEFENNFELNQINHTILSNSNVIFDLRFISNHPFSPFSKYYVNNVGRVWRWSESHKRIEKLFQEAKQKIYDGE